MFLETIRYALLRYIYCPLPVDRSFPLIGGKSLLEVVIALVVIVILGVIAGQMGDGSAGTLASIIGILTVIFSMRSNFLLTWIGFNFQHSLLWHKVLGIALIVVLFIHGVGEGSNSTGIALGVLCGLSMLSYVVLSKLKFDLFFYPHIVIFILIVIFSFMHGAPIFGFSIIVWGAELLLRIFLMQRHVTAKLSLLDKNHVVLSFPKGKMSYGAGQYCFLMVKQVNVFEFHPFTIASSPEDEEVTFIIKASGDWTSKLLELAVSGGGVEEAGKKIEREVDVYVQGPYGGLTLDFMNGDLYKGVLLITGGVGITAGLSIYQHLLAQNSPLARKVSLLWVTRDGKLASETYQRFVTSELRDVNASAKSDVENQPGAETADLTLSTSRRGKALDAQFHVYVSKVADDTDLPQSCIPKDLTHSGRPQLNLVFSDMAQAVKLLGGSRVAVMVCGPAPMIFEVKTKCDQSLLSCGCCGGDDPMAGVRFDCQEEYFGF
eukprot:gene3805-4155_t